MKRRLIIMRHAKSSWSNPTDSDHDRPLNKRGRRDAPRVAQRLAELGWSPDCVLASDSRRTQETCDYMTGEFAQSPSVQIAPALYLGGVEQFLDEIVLVPDEITCVLVLGHNPGCEAIAEWLTGREFVLKTGNAVLLESSGNHWSDAVSTSNSWRVHDIIRPREL